MKLARSAPVSSKASAHLTMVSEPGSLAPRLTLLMNE